MVVELNNRNVIPVVEFNNRNVIVVSLAHFKQHVERRCRKTTSKDGCKKIAMLATLKAGVNMKDSAAK